MGDIAQELAGRYRVDEHLGSGAGGETYAGVDLRDGTRVVVKRLALASAREWKAHELFEREGRVLAGLRHPAIPVHRESFVLETPGGPVSYLVHEYAPGKSLRGWVELGFRPDEGEIARIGVFLLEVLVHLHGLAPPVIHRDVKPANVIRSPEGRLWLVDFGAARDSVQVGAEGGSTVVGTYGYMAPEQFRGHAEPASDLYGVGATLLYLVSGRSPVEFPQEKLRPAFRGHAPMSSHLAAWIERALAPAPEDRFASAREALAALRGQAPAAAPASRPAAEPRRRSRVPVLLAVLAVLAGGALATGALRESGRALLAGVGARGAAAPSGPVRPLAERPPPFVEPLADARILGRAHPGLVYRIAVAPDAQVAASSGDGSVKLWRMPAGTELHALPGHEGKVIGLAFVAGGARLVSSGGTSVRVWDVATGTSRLVIRVPSALEIAVVDDEKAVVVAGLDGMLRVFDLSTGAPLRTIAQSEGRRILALAAAPDGRSIAAGSDDGMVRLWDVAEGRSLGSWKAGARTLGRVAFAPDGHLVVSAGDDGAVVAMATGTAPGVRQELFTHSFVGEAWGAAFSADGAFLATWAREGRLDLLQPGDGRLLGQIDFGEPMTVSEARFSPDGRWLLVGAKGHLVRYTLARRGLGTTPPVPGPDATGAPTPRDPDHALYLEAMRLELLGPTVPIEAAEAKVAEAMAASHERSPLAWIARAQITMHRAYQGGDPEYDAAGLVRARAHLDRAAGLGPKGVEWWITAARIARAQKDSVGAREATRQVYALVPGEPLTALNEARLEAGEGAHDRAVAILTGVVRRTRRPEIVARAYGDLATSYAALGDLAGAEAAHLARIELEPKNPWAHGNHAAFLVHRAGEPERAIAAARAALALSDYGAARGTLAQALVARGEQTLWEEHVTDRALRDFDEALHVDRGLARAHYDRAACHRFLAITRSDPGEARRAAEELDHALAVDPGLAIAVRAKGELPAVRARARGQ